MQDLRWVRPAVRLVGLTERQIRFLKFTVLLLSLLGAGIVWANLAQAWPQFQDSVPAAWREQLAHSSIGVLKLQPLAYPALEGWVAGAVAAAGLLAQACSAALGWHLHLARPLAWPFFWVRGSVENLVLRWRCQMAVAQAVQQHWARNQRQVAGQGKLAVCREHLARFEVRHARLAYERRWPYWLCRVCHSDAAAYTGVRLVRGVFDPHLVEPVHQVDTVLKISLLPRANGQAALLPLDLQEVEVAGAPDQHEVEAFIVAYRSATFPVKAPALSSLPLRLGPDASLEKNTERMLRQTFRS